MRHLSDLAGKTLRLELSAPSREACFWAMRTRSCGLVRATSTLVGTSRAVFRGIGGDLQFSHAPGSSILSSANSRPLTSGQPT